MANKTGTVLIISSDTLLINKIDFALKRLGYSSIVTENSLEALELIKSHQTLAVLIDMECDPSGGIKTLTAIKISNPELDCLVLTKQNDPEEIEISAKIGAFTISKEPLVEEQLILYLNYFIDKAESSRALKNTDKRFISFINKFQDGIAYVTMDGNIRDFNDAFQKMVGFSSDDLKKMTFLDLTPQKWHEMEKEIVEEKIIKRGYSDLYEKEYIHKNGAAIPIEISAFLAKNSEGEAESMWAFVRDISERKNAERTLLNQLKEVKVLHNLANAGAKAETVDDLLKEATWVLGKSLYSENFGIFIFDADEGILRRHFSFKTNMVDAQKCGEEISTTEGIIGRAFQSGQLQRVDDINKDVDYYQAYGESQSELTVPIIIHDKVFGVINTESPIVARYKKEDEDLLTALANQLATSIEKIHLNLSEKQQAKEITALYDTAIATSSITDTSELYQKIFEQVNGLFPLDSFLLVEYDEQDKSIRVAFIKEEGILLDNWMGKRFEKQESGLMGWMIDQQKPFISNDLLTDKLPIKPPSTEKPTRSWLGVPLITKGKIVGGLSVQAFAPNVFNKSHQRLLESLAAQLASAVDNAQLSQKNNHQIARLAALHDIDLAINSSLDLRVILNILLDQVIEKLEVDAAVVHLLDTSTHSMEYAASRGFHTRSIEQYKLHLDEKEIGKGAVEHHLIQAFNLIGEEDFDYNDLMDEEGFVSYYSVPLMAKGHMMGVMDIFNRNVLNPDHEWFNFLETLGGQAAIAIDNTSLLEGLQRSNADLRLAYDTTLEGWSKALDLRDKETEGHTQRVVEITIRIAQRLGITDEEIIHIRRGALLHDIGKMGIPDSILLKPGPLTEKEWEIMRLHPQYAYQLLNPITHLQPALDIPYRHHERWDGSGYPGKLKGEAIPIAARIFAVVDVWDALTSDRPYRKAWASKKALEYILEQRGKHFEPQIVDMFMSLIKSELINMDR